MLTFIPIHSPDFVTYTSYMIDKWIMPLKLDEFPFDACRIANLWGTLYQFHRRLAHVHADKNRGSDWRAIQSELHRRRVARIAGAEYWVSSFLFFRHQAAQNVIRSSSPRYRK